MVCMQLICQRDKKELVASFYCLLMLHVHVPELFLTNNFFSYEHF